MDDDKFVQIFKDEALELLGELEDILLELESDPDNSELISSVFRVMHTVKGSAGMVGLDNISDFTHEVESILESIRAGVINVNKGFIDYTLKSRDIILQMINDSDFEFNDNEQFFSDFKASLDSAPKPDIKEVKKESTLYRVLYTPSQKTFYTGTNPLIMVNEILELGEGIVLPKFKDIPTLSEINPEDCYISWEIFIDTSESINKINDIFIFIGPDSKVSVEEWNISDDENIPEKLGDLLVLTGKIEKNTLNSALGKQKKLGEILVEHEVASENDIKDALKTQKFIKSAKNKKNNITDSIRISSHKLDGLIDLVGEIVTIYAQMVQTSHNSGNSKLNTIIESFGLLTEELRDRSMSMRMLPLGSTFSRFKRLVRDLSAELGKQIDFKTDGEDTELDKHVIEQLHDPLVHIIRNCIDHGIESPQDRIAKGKDQTGTIKLSAIHSGSSVHIIIEDDGGGLNREKIRKKAEANKIIKQGENISDEDLMNLIFSPGFSTAGEITRVSGRGVGLDVVKQQIEALKGNVFIDSDEGVFTKITLVLPITLAIIEGLLVRINDDSYVIPLSSVEACVEINQDDKNTQKGRNVITFREKLIPYIDLRSFFNVQGDRNFIEQIVVVNTNSGPVGILVDHVAGSNQTVIKSLGSLYQNVKEISGAAIMGDGSVALVLDLEQLLRAVEHFEDVLID